MADCSICYDAVIDHPAPHGQEATGSHRSSCGHIFHPNCIAKWHKSHSRSTCPLCRKGATELEDCAPKHEAEAAIRAVAAIADVAALTREQRVAREREIVAELANLSAEYASLLSPVSATASAPEHAPFIAQGGSIRISRANFEQVLFNQGGPVGTWAAMVTNQLAFDEYDEVEICRNEFERILGESGTRVFWDAEWDHLMSIYPVPEPAAAPAALAVTAE